MRQCKIFLKVYIKSMLLLVLPIFIILIGWQLNVNNKIVSNAMLLSLSIESPSSAISVIKDKFLDKIVEIEEENNSIDKKDKVINDSDVDDKDKDDVLTKKEESLFINQDSNDVDNRESSGEDEDNIPDEFKGPIIEEKFNGGAMPLYVRTEPGFLANRTKLDSNTLLDRLKDISRINMNIDENPQVLLFSTHATESFEPRDRKFYDKRYNSRSTDNDKNVTRVEDKIAEKLLDKGIKTIVDKTQHDYPSYNGSYNRSARTIESYLKKYPSIKIILDIHRDAIERDNGERVKPVTIINGKKSAQIMIISGCDDGTMNFPNWIQNLKFAVDLQRNIELKYPGLTRPIFFCYRKYNMNVCPGSLLIEFGSNSNSLDEVMYAGELMGEVLSELLLSYNN